MLVIKEIHAPEFLDELLAFSCQVFGANSYQTDPKYYNWLYKLNPFAKRLDCCAAFDGSELVGVIHKMRLPLGGENSGRMIACLHNHIVKTDARAGVGFMLLKKAQKHEFSVFAPGVSGKTKLLYKNLNFSEIKTSWQVKPLAPLKLSWQILRSSLWSPKNANNSFPKPSVVSSNKGMTATLVPSEAQIDRISSFLNNDIDRGLSNTISVLWTCELVRWRFFSDIGPKHLLVHDQEMSRFAVVSLGSKSGVRVARLILISSNDSSVLVTQIGKIARQFGATLFMGYSQDANLTSGLAKARWKERRIETSGYFINQLGKSLNGGAPITDFGFESLQAVYL